MARSVPLPTLLGVLAVLALAGGPDALAQSAWPTMTPGHQLGAEFSHAYFDVSEASISPAGTLVLSARPMMGAGFMVLEVPISYGIESVDGGGTAVRNDGIGNPYVGIDAITAGSGAGTMMEVEFGVNIPLVKSRSRHLGGLESTHFVSSPGAWRTNTLTVSALQNVGFQPGPGVLFHLRFGPSVLIPTRKEGEDRNVEILGIVGLRFRYFAGPVSASVGFDARSFVSGRDGSLDDRTVQQLSFDLEGYLLSLTPYVGVRVPIGGDDDDWLNGGWVLRGGLRITLPGG